MTQDEIDDLSRQARNIWHQSETTEGMSYFLKAFAKLVAVKEREACCADDIVNSANIMANDMPHTVIEKYQAAIRARGEA